MRVFTPPPTPLTELAGRRLRLAFVTQIEGEIEMNPCDFTGFGMLWNDPQLEYGP